MLDFLSTHKGEIALIIDIGNGSVGAGLVQFKKGEVPKLLYSVRTPFSIQDVPDASHLTSEMKLLLDKALLEIVKQKPRLGVTLVGFSSPWFISHTSRAEASQEKSFLITESFLDQICKSEEELLKKETEHPDESFTIVEKSIVHTKLNGYPLNSVIGKSTKSFEASLYLSIIPEKLITDVKEIIAKHTHIGTDKILIHTFPLASFTVLRDIFPTTSDFIIMDITGEVTDLTLVRDNIIQATVSFPSGRNFIIRQISKSFDVSFGIAESILHLYSDNKADDQVYDQMQKVFAEVEKEWSIYFEDALENLSPELALPHTLYITADNDVADLSIKFIKLSKTDKTGEFRNNVDIMRVDHTTLSSLYVTDTRMTDEFIGILSIFYNKLYTQS